LVLPAQPGCVRSAAHKAFQATSLSRDTKMVSL
jgi:hypothetical protein